MQIAASASSSAQPAANYTEGPAHVCVDVVVLAGGPMEGSRLNWGAPDSSSNIVPRGCEETTVTARFCPVAWATWLPSAVKSPPTICNPASLT